MNALGSVNAPAMAPFGSSAVRREIRGVTASAERRLLLWLAARLPGWIGSDLLTIVGLLGTIGAAASYWQAGSEPLYLHVANFFLFVNWFGDSLDGTVARYRNRQRPKYGYYLDHVVDTVGAAVLLGGLAAGGLMSAWVAAALLGAYYLVSIDMYLATHSLGAFRVGHAGVGGTELRLLLMLLNLVLLGRTHIVWGGFAALVFDVAGVLGAVGMTGAFFVSAARNTATLYRLEPLPPRGA